MELSLLMGSNSLKDSGIRDVKGFLQNICRILWLYWITAQVTNDQKLISCVEERLQLCLLEECKEAKYLFSNTSKTKTKMWGRLNDAYRLLKMDQNPREMAPQQSTHSAPSSPGKNGEGWKSKVSPTVTHSPGDLRCHPSPTPTAPLKRF